MLVSVRVARSFFELVNENVNFTTSFQSSRNMVTANVLLNFGQTLILSGLTEHEIQRGSSGVPVLKDIPALQYLFSNHTEQNFTSSVIVMLTPRKPVTDSTDAARAIAESGNKTYALNDMAGDFLDINKRATTTLDSALWHSQSNSMYFQFRNGDLKTQDWNESSRLDKLLKEIRQLLYF
jgi:type II secretory pathway component GspD/PulD (secretin)